MRPKHYAHALSGVRVGERGSGSLLPTVCGSDHSYGALQSSPQGVVRMTPPPLSTHRKKGTEEGRSPTEVTAYTIQAHTHTFRCLYFYSAGGSLVPRSGSHGGIKGSLGGSPPSHRVGDRMGHHMAVAHWSTGEPPNGKTVALQCLHQMEFFPHANGRAPSPPHRF